MDDNVDNDRHDERAGVKDLFKTNNCDIIHLFQTGMHLPVCTIKEYRCHHVYYWYVVFGHSFISRNYV